MTSNSLRALRSASSFLLSTQSATRTWRLDVKRSIYLSGPDNKKKKKKEPLQATRDATGKTVVTVEDPALGHSALLKSAPLLKNDDFRLNKNVANNRGVDNNKKVPARNSPNPSRVNKSLRYPADDLGDLAFDPDEFAEDLGRFYPDASSPAPHVSPPPPHPRSTIIKIQSLVEMIRMRREQASRTILFAPDLAHAVNPCPRYMRHRIETFVGRVRHVALTSLVTSSKTDIYGALSSLSSHQPEKFLRKSLLVEFQDSAQMEKLIRQYSQPFPSDKASFNSRLLYCHGRWSQSAEKDSSVELSDALNSCSDVSQQMLTLVKRTELDDAGLRARFFLCHVIESLIKPIFPGCNLIPFGSTLSGLGRADSDMDVVMRFPSHEVKENVPFCAFSVRSADLTDARAIVIRQLTLVHEIMRTALPGYCEFNRIFRANVPIITFRHSYTNLCCDLSIQSNDSILAAQLFSAYTSLDPRVRPFIFAVRRWSIAQSLSSFLTNFPLCCLALFFLMEEKVVPPMNLAFDCHSGNVTFIPTGVHWQSPNSTSSLGDLLSGFFRFYADFEFERDAISVFLGKRQEKLTMDIVEVENPLNRELNCARLIETCSRYADFRAALVAADTSLRERGAPISVPEKVEVDGEENAKKWGLSCVIEELSRKSDGDGAEVFLDTGDDAVLDVDGDLGAGGGDGDGGTIFRQQWQPRKQPREEVTSILNKIFEKDGEKTLEEGQQQQQQLSPIRSEEELSLNPVRFIEDEDEMGRRMDNKSIND